MNYIVKGGGEILAFLLVGVTFIFLPWLEITNSYIIVSDISEFVRIPISIFGVLFLFIAYRYYQKAFIVSDNAIEVNNIPDELKDNPSFQDVTFWFEAFNKLPFPVFIKEFNRGKEQHEHIIVNKAMIEFESSEFEDKRFSGDTDMILEDYIKGDTITYNKGFYKQIELCMNMEDGVSPSTILTMKNLLVHADKSYIVGAYIPIEPKKIIDKNSYKVKYSKGQLVLSISESTKSDSAISINIGDAVKNG